MTVSPPSWISRLLGLLLVLSFAGCGDDDDLRADQPGATRSSQGAAETLDGETPISFHGIGPIRAGMTISEAEEAAGRPMIIVDFEQFGGHCYFAYPEGMKDDVILTILSPDEKPVTNPKDGVVGRASVEDGFTSSPATTEGGVGIGASAGDVRAAYRGFSLSESKHHYIDGLYLDVEAADSEMLLRFETRADGTVFVIHAGAPHAVTLVEGCA